MGIDGSSVEANIISDRAALPARSRSGGVFVFGGSSSMKGRALPPKLRWSIFERDGFRCTYCGRSAGNGVELRVDHVVAWAEGGTDDLSNLTTACDDCNSGKSNQPAPKIIVQARQGDQCPTRMFLAWCSVFMYGQTYDQVYKLIYSSMERSGYRMPPRDRALDRYWYGFAKVAYAEWSADKLA
jgi:hypothetical protein